MAEQSGGSAKEINTLVSRTQEKAKAALKAINIGGEMMQEGLHIVGQAKVSFDEILNDVESVGGRHPAGGGGPGGVRRCSKFGGHI